MTVEGTICQIYWHKKLPVYSVDFERVSCSNSDFQSEKLKFATAGADCNVRIWELDVSSPDAKVDYVSTLSKHIKGVNSVRWAPSVPGLLCSAGDSGALFVWQRVDSSFASSASKPSGLALLDHELDDELTFAKETWKVKLSLENSNPFDIYAAEWSSDSNLIATGASDDTVRIYSLKECRCVRVVKDHTHFVSGIAWDPLGSYFASCSSDRSVKISKYAFAKNSTSELRLTSPGKIYRFSPKGASEADSFRLFCDETLMSFFRRGSFSPDGAFFVAPAGLTADGSFCVHVFIRSAFDSFILPLFSVAGFDKPTIGVFFCPVPLKLCDLSTCSSLCMVGTIFYLYAVLTLDAVYLFESKNNFLLFSLKSFHYGTLTDASWSRCGSRLLVTSNDGFVSSYTIDLAKIAAKLDAVIAEDIKEDGDGETPEAANNLNEPNCEEIHLSSPITKNLRPSTPELQPQNVSVEIFPLKRRITPFLVQNPAEN